MPCQWPARILFLIRRLRQGTYDNAGDIVVLCMYLGQLVQIKKQLAGEVMTVLDDRDLAQLADTDEVDEAAGVGAVAAAASAQRVQVAHRV